MDSVESMIGLFDSYDWSLFFRFNCKQNGRCSKVKLSEDRNESKDSVLLKHVCEDVGISEDNIKIEFHPKSVRFIPYKIVDLIVGLTRITLLMRLAYPKLSTPYRYKKKPFSVVRNCVRIYNAGSNSNTTSVSTISCIMAEPQPQ